MAASTVHGVRHAPSGAAAEQVTLTFDDEQGPFWAYLTIEGEKRTQHFAFRKTEWEALLASRSDRESDALDPDEWRKEFLS